MQHIVLRTPSDDRNSNFSAHLIEHIKVHNDTIMPGYFDKQKYNGDTNATHSTYTLQSDDNTILQQFIEHLLSPIDPKKYAYEKKVIRDEFSYQNIHQRLTEKVGQYFHGPTYRYTRATKSCLQSIQEYHRKYYTRQNIWVLDKDTPSKDIQKIEMPNIFPFSIRLWNERYEGYHTEITPVSLFVFTHLEKIYDSYIDMKGRYQDGIYYRTFALTNPLISIKRE